jgi:hypothetical protein
MSIFSCQWWYAAHAISIDSAHAISIDSAHAISPPTLAFRLWQLFESFWQLFEKNNTNGFIVSVIFLG